MIAVRYVLDGGVFVERLDPSLDQAAVQRLIDLAIAKDDVCTLWAANDRPVKFHPNRCEQIQVLELGKA